MKLLLTATAVLFALGATAQQQVKIIDPSLMRLDPELHKNKAATAGMQAAGITVDQQELVLNYSDPKYWPVGLASDSARKANAPYFQNYVTFPVCTYRDDTTLMNVVMVPAKENIHMPEDMRPIADLYFVVPASATKEVQPPAPRPAISKGPRWKDLADARILSPGDLYATYDLAADKEGLAKLADRGMSQPEIDAVIFRSHERNWPEGIDGFQERQDLLPQFKKYKAFVGAKWGDKVLLVIPAEKNRKMPILLRPYVDIYFIYNASAVEVKEKKRKR